MRGCEMEGWDVWGVKGVELPSFLFTVFGFGLIFWVVYCWSVMVHGCKHVGDWRCGSWRCCICSLDEKPHPWWLNLRGAWT